ncbi:hypothetical protein [Leucobacter sp. USHLN153]|uniref:hypothetical protein n=1 Tax=Leucobacter sp. USHLN153 TaxID=3081268 RepID=UPI00301611B0
MIAALWPALAALGAGLVLFATAAGAPAVLALLLGGAAAAELLWALAVLRAGRVVAPRGAVAGGAIGVLGAGFLLLTGPLALVPFVALFIFHWSIAIAGVVALRRGADRRAPARVGVDGQLADQRAPAEVVAGGQLAHQPRVSAARIEPAGSAAAVGTLPRSRSAGSFTLVLVAEALLVAAIATPALAASEAGEFAVPHGTFGHGHAGH